MSSITKTLLFFIALAAVLTALPGGISHALKNETSDDEKKFRTCSQNMEITDVRFSSRADLGIEVIFDDIGCAIIWRNLQGAFDQTAFDSKATARDFNNLSSVLMSRAFYVINKKLRTPIGFGIAAFRDINGAKAFIKAKGSGRLMNYKEIIRLDLKPPVPPEEDPKKKK